MRLRKILARQHCLVTRGDSTKQLINVLSLTLARHLNQAELGELGDLRARRVIAHRRHEMLQQLQLIATGIHVDEVDDDHASDVAELQLPSNLDSRFAIGPEDRLTGIGGTGEGARVHIDHSESLGGLDDHVTAGGKIHPRFESITDGRIHLEVLKQLVGFGVCLH